MTKYRLRSTSKKGAARLAKYALVEPKISSIKVKKRASKRYFGEYMIQAKKMKMQGGRPLKGTLFVKPVRKKGKKK